MWNLEEYENRIAIVSDDGRIIHYSDICKYEKEIISIINHRTLVFILCKNEPGCVISYLTCLNNGIVPILLSANSNKYLLNELMELYRPEYIFFPKELEEAEALSSELNIEKMVLAKTKYSVDYDMDKALALLLTTSGSTGSPKFVRQSYDNIIANTNDIIEYLNIKTSDRAITTLPMNYTYGLSIINTHIMVGATLLMTDKSILQKEFWDFFVNEKATTFGGVPYTYEMLDKLRFCKMNLTHLEYMTQAGGKISEKLHRRFAEYAEQSGKKFIVMYGQSEATARMGYLPAGMAMEKCNSMGIAIPNGRFWLVDEQGEIIEQNDTVGELVYEGKNVTLGYATCLEDLKKGDERNGVLYTGDMAKRDNDGFYYIVGRKKRFLKIYGNRVNLDDMERMIRVEFEDLECVCAGIDDKMYIFLTKFERISDIKEMVIKKTGLSPSAFSYIEIDSIPRNESGKIKYNELEKYYC